MIRGAMEVGGWCLGVVFGCGSEAIECLCAGIKAYFGFGHDG